MVGVRVKEKEEEEAETEALVWLPKVANPKRVTHHGSDLSWRELRMLP